MNDELNQDTGTMVEDATRIAESAQNYAEDKFHAVRAKAGEALTRGEEYVRRNPVPIVLGALAVGLLVGVAISRREEPTLRERYVDEPLGQARDLFYSVLAPVASRLRDEFGSAQSAAGNAAEKLQDLGGQFSPMFKQARRAAGKLKFW